MIQHIEHLTLSSSFSRLLNCTLEAVNHPKTSLGIRDISYFIHFYSERFQTLSSEGYEIWPSDLPFPLPLGTTDLSSVRSERTGRMAESHCKGRYVYPWSTLAFMLCFIYFYMFYFLKIIFWTWLAICIVALLTLCNLQLSLVLK